jgi:hypothetical protein
MYKLYIRQPNTIPDAIIKFNTDGSITSFLFDESNTDYQAFKSAVLEQQINAVMDEGDSFSISSDQSILEDADGNVMTIDQAKDYVRTLP